jgi:hypothetical protein
MGRKTHPKQSMSRRERRSFIWGRRRARHIAEQERRLKLARKLARVIAQLVAPGQVRR